MVVVKKSYRKYNRRKLVTFSTNFNQNLFLSTAIFPSPPLSQTTIEKAIQDYENAAELGRVQRSDYNTGQTLLMRKTLIEKLDMQVAYVETNAPDVAAVEAVGLEAAATKSTKAPLPGKPEGEGAKESGEPQSVVVFCKPVKLDTSAEVSYYVFETNADGTVQLGLMISGTNSQRLPFGGLTTGKVYYFYIRAKTTAGFGPPSDPVRWVGR